MKNKLNIVCIISVILTITLGNLTYLESYRLEKLGLYNIAFILLWVFLVISAISFRILYIKHINKPTPPLKEINKPTPPLKEINKPTPPLKETYKELKKNIKESDDPMVGALKEMFSWKKK